MRVIVAGFLCVDLIPEFLNPPGEPLARLLHPGGTINEMLSIYTLVNALTENLPAVTPVQVMVDGQEVETLAGHVDLRRPLAKNLAWVE